MRKPPRPDVVSIFMAVVEQPPAGSLLAFFSLTYAVTWPCFIAACVLQAGIVRAVLLFLGTVAPSLVALSLTARAEGGTGTQALLNRLVEWRVGARWYVFALGYMVAVKLSVAVVHRAALGTWPRFGNEAWYVIIAAIVASTPFQSGEEIGWRGYALPRLAMRFGYAAGSLLLGLIWACWHLPLFFLPGSDKQGQSFAVYALQVTALSVALAWLYMHTNGSLLLAMVMHSAVNQTKDIVPSIVSGAVNPFALSISLTAWLTVAILWLGAGSFLFRMFTREVKSSMFSPGS
jgi:membrane protease YdiL (CAAX protease family)